MNKKKVIFIIWLLILSVLIVIWVSFLNSDTQKSTWPTNTAWSFKIWVFWDDKGEFGSFIADFKNLNQDYSSTVIEVENFSDWEDYEKVLASSIISWNSPDIFVLNNNETSIFESQVLALDPSIINPNDFRKKYKWVFGDDLIVEIVWEDETKTEYLAWIPVWYETLWVFYNRRYVKASDLNSLASLGNAISSIKRKDSSITPIWMWNWTTVYDSQDIATQFFMLEWLSSLEEANGTKLKQSLWSYFYYWSENSDNAYDSKFIEQKTLWENNIDLFSKWEVVMVVWYPRMLLEIDREGFSKNFLLANPFPHNLSWDWKTFVNYNYFVINKDTQNKNLAYSFLKFLSSDIWAENYFKRFPYYLPSLLSLETDKLDSKVLAKYNIVLWDFINDDSLLSSFNKGMKTIYDRQIKEILDDSSNYIDSFEGFRIKLLCKSRKAVNLENLSWSCE